MSDTFLRHEDIREGDWLGGLVCGSDQHGVVRAIDLDQQLLNYQDGTPVRVQRGGMWVVSHYVPARWTFAGTSTSGPPGGCHHGTQGSVGLYDTDDQETP